MQAPFTTSQLQEISIKREAKLREGGQEALDKYDERISDVRYSINGNIPVSRFNIPNSRGSKIDFGNFAPRLTDTVSSGFYRMTSVTDDVKIQPDFYSPDVKWGSIRPGTALYDGLGHVGIVYEITPNGDVLFTDAHPDNSVSHKVFNRLDFKGSNVQIGANFKNFRPLEVQNPVYDSEQNIVSGQIIFARDNQIPDFSLLQYVGHGKAAGSNVIQYKLRENETAIAYDFHEWVNYKLSEGRYRLNPLKELKSEIEGLCKDLNGRETAVQEAVVVGMHLKAHPERLPNNIFGSEGDWESYASPSRDLRLREKALNIISAAKVWQLRSNKKDVIVQYAGNNLRQDLIDLYMTETMACQFSYKNSRAISVSVPFEEIISRLSNISYDPYMCPELRWGAASEAELRSCSGLNEKLRWHKAQQFFRNNLKKDTKGVHSFSLIELEDLNLKREDIDLNYNLLKQLQQL